MRADQAWAVAASPVQEQAGTSLGEGFIAAGDMGSVPSATPVRSCELSNRCACVPESGARTRQDEMITPVSRQWSRMVRAAGN